MAGSKKTMISKSKYMSGLQCMKYMWNQVHAREEIPGAGFFYQVYVPPGTSGR